MNPCLRIRPLLEWLAADEIDDDRRHLAEEHVRVCPACRRELADWRALLAAAAAPAAAAAAEMQAIDWSTVFKASREKSHRPGGHGEHAGQAADGFFLHALGGSGGLVGL